MLIDWLKFGPALVLLLTPIGLFHGRQVRFRALPASFDSYWGRTFALGLHWIDFGRAMLGAWLLADALSPRPELTDAMSYALSNPQVVVLATEAGVLLAATLLQTFVCKEVDAANPPFAFVIGLVLGFLPPVAAAFALFVGIMAGLGIRSPGAFFPVLGLVVVGASALFTGRKMVFSGAALGLTMMTPWLFTLLFPRHFVIAYAPKKTPAGTPPEPPER